MRSRYANRALAWCAIACAPAQAVDLNVEVRDLQGHALADAVVYAEPLDGRAPPGTGAPQVRIDQVGKQFAPRVSVMRAGTEVSFRNSDNIRHSVYSFSPAKVFTTKLYAGRHAAPIVFDQSGVIVLGCNCHDQMLAWAVIVDTPYFGKSAANGMASLNGLLPGPYRLSAWYPGLTEPVVETVRLTGDGASEQVRLDASRSPLPRSPT